ncbi:enoyl-CoA hydratase-related protein [Neptuniibacter sp. CAU 1671]|uniref:enoyl-CoA hydratase-related protein n=1 Tax=Neptuniibacter sp. CAU 1671 TaxID=3032593 RepID=UPI0023DB18E5|nr:enoyl-CoA hydratase-related protein [Neptuniibacter sp. CAU 1671]MDF2180879.1 enoyl-CoA hydratase-related protein [Neptuniibacter sp. CAU 1671]
MQNWITQSEPQPGRVILRLNRPEKRNALTGDMVQQLLGYLEQLTQRSDLWLLQLEGAGHWFCSGVDLNWMQQMGQAEWSENLKDAELLANVLDRLWHFPCPTLCKVQGGAMGGGLGLLACCDTVLATSASRFACSEVRLGLIPAVIAPYLMHSMGGRQSMQHMLSGEPFSAAEAFRAGLVSELCRDNDALEQQTQLRIKQLQQGHPQALRQCKQLIRQLQPLSLPLATGQWLAEIRRSVPALEGVAAFLAKRRPNWSN